MSLVLLSILAAVFLGPIVGLFSEGNLPLLQETLSSPKFIKGLLISLTTGFSGALISVVFGIYFGRQFALTQWRKKRIQRLVLLIPYLVPNFILATAYVLSWNPVTGVLNSWLRFPNGVYGSAGMIVLFSVTHMPVAFLLLEEKFRRLDSSWREAALLSGASPSTILFRIELPLLVPTILAAFALCFSLNISAFAIPAWIGAPAKTYPLTYQIYQAIQLGGVTGIPKASVISLVLFFLSLPPLLLSSLLSRNEKKYSMLSGKSARATETIKSPIAFLRFQLFFWIYQLVLWMGPIAALFLSTLTPPGCLQDQGAGCFKEVSLRSYRYVLFELKETEVAIRSSLVYGSLSALLIVLIALVTLIVFSKRKKSLRVLEWIFALPIATPGAILALGLIVVASGRYGINLYNTPWIVVAAYVIKHLSLAFQPLRTGLMGVSESLVEAARLSGSGTFGVWRRIILPILKPECLGALFLVLIPILGELTMSVFLSSPSFRSIGTVLFDLQDYADQASAGSLSILLVLLILLINEIARLLSRGKLGY